LPDNCGKASSPTCWELNQDQAIMVAIKTGWFNKVRHGFND